MCSIKLNPQDTSIISEVKRLGAVERVVSGREVPGDPEEMKGNRILRVSILIVLNRDKKIKKDADC